MLQDPETLVQLLIDLPAVLLLPVEYPTLNTQPLDVAAPLSPDLFGEVEVVFFSCLPPIHY